MIPEGPIVVNTVLVIMAGAVFGPTASPLALPDSAPTHKRPIWLDDPNDIRRVVRRAFR